MALFRTRNDHGYDLTYASANGAELTVFREEALHRSRHLSTEGALGIRREQSTVHHAHRYHERDPRYLSNQRDQAAVSEMVRENHRKTDQLNHMIQPRASYSQVHPKMMFDGNYPTDFSLALTVDEFEVMDTNALDRILIAYGLLCSFSGSRGSSRDIRKRKLWRLFEFLGADHLTPPRDISHGQRQARGATDSYIAW